MNQYIATFYSHFGATRYKKICDEQGLKAKVMPVPRTLSSSCGTCVSYTADSYVVNEKYIEELEQIVVVTDQGYEVVFSQDDQI